MEKSNNWLRKFFMSAGKQDKIVLTKNADAKDVVLSSDF